MGAPPRASVAGIAWKVFLVLSAVLVLFGVGDMISGGSTYASGESVAFTGITGMTWEELEAAEPTLARFVDVGVRTSGLTLTVAGLLSAAICLTALRRGARWAWFAMLVWPLWMVGILVLALTVDRVPGAGTPVPVVSGSIVLVVSLATLALSAPRFLRSQT